MFFYSKLVFIKESHSTVIIPAGLGTIDEGFKNLTLFQTGKCMPDPLPCSTIRRMIISMVVSIYWTLFC
ncbi:MAG TPA: hypothetical protein HPP54_00195 [Nitrospinae bacterium]|nr:hypothetical protein [Nitrospinota bacterium]